MQLPVPAMGPTDSDQRHPGSKVATAKSRPVRCTASRWPRGKSRRSSGLSSVLTSIMTLLLPAVAEAAGSGLRRHDGTGGAGPDHSIVRLSTGGRHSGDTTG